ncbi:hypothetical protein TNIN_125051 [Trichonephila inaurata madagascariensis]|nr:hypothetical protein TNIN_125051 [Trichonephila inaurata madagascariensis]
MREKRDEQKRTLDEMIGDQRWRHPPEQTSNKLKETPPRGKQTTRDRSKRRILWIHGCCNGIEKILSPTTLASRARQKLRQAQGDERLFCSSPSKGTTNPNDIHPDHVT